MLSFSKKDRLLSKFKNQYVNDTKKYWAIMQDLPFFYYFLTYLSDNRLLNEKEVERFINDRNT